jgi:hypothetical protein
MRHPTRPARRFALPAVEEMESRQVPSASGLALGLLGTLPARAALVQADTQHGTITLVFSPINRSVNAVESLLRNFERHDSPGLSRVLSRLTQGLFTPPAATPPSANPTGPSNGPGSTPTTPPSLVSPPLNLPGDRTDSPTPQPSPGGPSEVARPAGTLVPLPSEPSAAPQTPTGGTPATPPEGGPALIGGRSIQTISMPASGGGDVEEMEEAPPADDPDANQDPQPDRPAPEPMALEFPPEQDVALLAQWFPMCALAFEQTDSSRDEDSQPAVQEGWDTSWLALTLAGVAVAAEGARREMGAKAKTPAPPAHLHPPG